MQGDLHLAGVNTLALTRPATMVQGSHYRRRQKAGSDRVGVGLPGTVRRQVRPAGHLVEAGDGAGVIPVAGEGRGGTALAHEAGAGHDDRGVQRAVS